MVKFSGIDGMDWLSEPKTYIDQSLQNTSRMNQVLYKLINKIVKGNENPFSEKFQNCVFFTLLSPEDGTFPYWLPVWVSPKNHKLALLFSFSTKLGE